MPLENVCATWSVPQTKRTLQLWRSCLLSKKKKKLDFPSAFSCESCWLTSSHARCPVKSLWIEESACKATISGRICQLWHSSWSLNCSYFHFRSQQTPRCGRKTGVSRGAALPVKQQMAHRHSSQTKCVSQWCVWNDSAIHVWHSRSFKNKVAPTQANEKAIMRWCLKLPVLIKKTKQNKGLPISLQCVQKVPIPTYVSRVEVWHWKCWNYFLVFLNIYNQAWEVVPSYIMGYE